MAIQTLLPSPWQRFCDNNGNPAVGYLVYTYQSGTTTPAVTYTDFTGTQRNLNPIVLDFRGECSIWGPPNVAYTYVFTFPNDTVPPSNPIKTVNGIQNGLSLTPAIIGAAIYPQTAAEANINFTPNTIYPYGNLLRLGLIPNSSGAAANNTLYMTQYFNTFVTNGPAGTFYFPNTTGSDIYYFNDLIAVEGVVFEFNDVTWQLTKGTASGNETEAGAITAIRDTTLQNGTISVAFTGGSNQCACVTFGARGSECGGGAFFPNTYDASLTVAQGNCHLKNMRLTTNNPLGLHVQLTGGLQNCSFEDIFMNGQGQADGIDYEFGWATSGTPESVRQSSHAHNLRFTNINFTNGNTSNSAEGALTITAAYNAKVSGLYVDQSIAVATVRVGESMFYQPWIPTDLVGRKRNVILENVVGSRISGTAMNLTGTGSASASYLASVIAALPTISQYSAQTDLYDIEVDGFVLDGSGNPGNGFGISASAGRLILRNGFIFGGFQRGIVSSDEGTIIDIDQVAISGCSQQGMQLYGSPIWSPTRLKKGSITRCYIAGNSTATIGGSSGIDLKNCDGVLIEDNFLGYALLESGGTEATQGNGVSIDATCFNVICRANTVNVAPGVSAIAYYNADNTLPGQGNIIESASGTATSSGLWQDGVSVSNTLTYSASMTPDCSLGSDFIVTLTDNNNFTINAPLNPKLGMHLTLTIRAQTSAPGTATFNAIYKMSTWTNPANTFSRSITFRWNNVAWVQISQTGADVPN